MTRLPTCIIVSLILSTLLGTAVVEANGSKPPPRTAALTSAAAAYGGSALHFEPNIGQAEANVRFLARGLGYGVYLTPAEAVLSLNRGTPATSDVLRLKLIGGARAPSVSGEEPLAGRSNYFLGSDRSKWRKGIPHYGRVSLRDVYPGITLSYYGNQNQLEYDFVVSPGADPRRIRLGVEGAEGIRLDEGGNVVLVTKAGDVVQKKPIAYQEIEGARRPVESQYRIVGRKEVRLTVGAYDIQYPLVIDPLLVYSTYLAGSGVDDPRGVAVDDTGAIYVTGYTGPPVDTPFPTTVGAYQTTYAGGNHDVFIAKLRPGGQGPADLLYSTYLGGGSDDIGWGIAVDASGAAYVAGVTLSGPGFPTTAGAFQTTSLDWWDGFLVKLDPSGGLAYSTYLGGGSIDEARGLPSMPRGTPTSRESLPPRLRQDRFPRRRGPIRGPMPAPTTRSW
jgi:hypothetical protein